MKILKIYKNMSVQVKASFWFTVCGFLQKGITMLTTPIFTRLLTPSEYGMFSVFSTWQSVLTIFASLNLASGVYLRGLIKYEDDTESFTLSLQSLYLMNMVVVFGVYLFFSDFWNKIFEFPTHYICLMFADILVQTAFHFWSARQRVEFKYTALVTVTLLNAVIRTLASVAMVYLSEEKLAARIFTMIAVDIIIFGYFVLEPFIRYRSKKINVEYCKYALSYNLPLIPHYLSQIVLNQSDRVMIKKMVGNSAAGIYSLAYNVAGIMLIVNQSVLNTFNPWLYKKMKAQEYAEIRNTSKLILGFIGFANLLVIAVGPEIIKIFASPSYYEAIWVIPPVALGIYFVFLYNLFSNLEFYFEKTKNMMWASMSGAVLNIVLNMLCIPRFGYLAAGYTTLVCYLCYCFLHYYLMCKVCKENIPGIKVYDMKYILTFSIALVITSAVFMSLYENTVGRYIAIVIVLLVMALIMWRAYSSSIKK